MLYCHKNLKENFLKPKITTYVLMAKLTVFLKSAFLFKKDLFLWMDKGKSKNNKLIIYYA